MKVGFRELCAFCGSRNPEAPLSFLKKLFGGKSEPVQRTRVCVECGMPVANHKDWCSILRGQQELELRAASK